jgi:hypothetical protein
MKGHVAHFKKWIPQETSQKRPLAKPRHKLKNNITKYLSKIWCEGTD